jgi:hypothetical protein
MPPVERYIGICQPENSTVDRGISQGLQWNARDEYFQCTPLTAGFIYYIILNVVKLNHTQQTICLLWINHCRAMFCTVMQVLAFIKPQATKLCGYNNFVRPSVRPSIRPCVIVCCRLDSAYICWSLYTKLWEVVSKSMDVIDFQKNLSRGSLFCEGDLVKFVS